MPEQHEQAVLFSDIRDFTTITANRGDREAYRLVQTFVDLVEEQVQSKDGKVIKTYGDGVMNTFPEVESSLKASIGMQRALRQHNEEHPEDTISAGIGLNWGSTIKDDDDIFGHSVNLAARLAGSAKGGQILVSSSVQEKSEVYREYEFIDLDYLELKGIGKEKVAELLWQDEVSRLTTKNDKLNLVLTEDHLSIELSKELQEELNSVREELRREADKQSGIAKFVLNKVETYVDRYLSRAVGWALAKKGIGLEHSIKDIQLEFSDERVVFSIRGDEALTLTEKEIDISSAREFAKRFKSLKSSLGSEI